MRILYLILVFQLAALANLNAQTVLPSDSIEFFRRTGNYLQALRIGKLWQKQLPENAPDSIRLYALETIADLLVRLNENKEAEQVIGQWLDLLRKSVNENHIDFAMPYNRLGTIHYNLGNFPKALENYSKSMDLRIRQYGPDHPEVARSLSNMANVYLMTGHYTKAEELYLKTHEIRLKHLPPNDPALGHSCNGLGLVYRSLGDYPKSESYFIKGLNINISRLGPDHPNVGAIYNNLGTLAEFIGDYTKAEKYFQEGLRIRKLAHGESNVLVAQNYFHLGRLYELSGQLPKAGMMLEKGGTIYLREYGPEHIFTANWHFLKGGLLLKQKQYIQAEAELLSAKKIWERSFGKEHLKVAEANSALGILYKESGAFSKALSLLKESYATQLRFLGDQHPVSGVSQHEMGLVYMHLAQEDSAEKWFRRAVDHTKNQITMLFPVLSEREKEKFYHTSAKVFKEYFAFSALRYPRNPEVAGEMYNLVLASKALLLNNSAKWKQRIRSSGDRKLLQLYTIWESNQNLISKLMANRDSAGSDSLQSLTDQNEKLEKELSSRYQVFNSLTDKKFRKWQDVSKMLHQGEAAIEIVRMNPWGFISEKSGKPEVAKNAGEAAALLNTPVYVALVLKYGDLYPRLVSLPDGQKLEALNFYLYQNCIRNKFTDTISYRNYWATIARALGKNTKRVYFSPDGVYHFINPATLFHSRTKKYLLEELDIRLVTVTNELLESEKLPPQNRLSYLFGSPEFGDSLHNKDSTSSRGGAVFSFLGEVDLPDLPGSKKEIKAISTQLIESGWEVYHFTQAEASEEKIKDIFTPRLLHIATHGFFIHDSAQNPLFCSGLFLSGANTSRREWKAGLGEDGILTAYEAMNLNLDNTDLVVLSACETGLGEVKTGEGVYGLQRAFKVAGARSIIMSLWKVDDEATQELMVAFYKNWLAGSTKRSAFLKAQKALKITYPHPYYWGAFVMVGE